MLAIRTILFPTDFSHRSEYAFRMATAVARDYGARLVVVHVAPPPLVVYGEGMIAEQPELYQGELKEKLGGVLPADAKVAVEHVLADGDPATEILRLAKERNCDLIVMATHGWTGLTRLLMGSVAEAVVRKAPCPVLTVKAPSVAKEPAKPERELVGANI
jgi:nucleotide-binding universal stress UspA family protein